MRRAWRGYSDAPMRRASGTSFLLQDAHPGDSLQFEDFGRHAMEGTLESETVDELAALPFSDGFTVMPKESLDPAHGTGFDRWFDERPRLSAVVVVGDCTDICVYQTAMHLETRSTANRIPYRVIVPASCVQTYDVSVARARESGGLPHDADVLHLIFLYHLALCGVRVVAEVE